MATRRTPHSATDSASDTDTTSPALGPLEGLFGQRVAKAMSQMGMPAPLEVAALREQVQALQARVERLEAALAAAPASAAPAVKKSATAVKKAPASPARSRQPRS